MRTRTVAGVAATIIGAGGLAFAGTAPVHAAPGKGTKCDFNLRINKVDSANGTPLAGAKFKITAPEDVWLMTPEQRATVSATYQEAATQASNAIANSPERKAIEAYEAARTTAWSMGLDLGDWITRMQAAMLAASKVSELAVDDGAAGIAVDSKVGEVTAKWSEFIADAQAAQASGTAADFNALSNKWSNEKDTLYLDSIGYPWAEGLYPEPSAAANDAAVAALGQATHEFVVTTGADGAAEFASWGLRTDLIPCGDLVVEEMSAPQGYVRASGTVNFAPHIEPASQVLEVKNDKTPETPSTPEEPQKPKDPKMQHVIKTPKGPKVPDHPYAPAGGSGYLSTQNNNHSGNSPLPLLGGSAALLFGLGGGVLALRRRFL